MRILKILSIIWAANSLLLSGGAFGQQAVTTLPAPATSSGGNVSGTLAATNTWQQVFADQGLTTSSGVAKRRGCTVINQGTHDMYIEEGVATAAASTANAVKLSAGQAFYCQTGNVVLQGAIQLYGTIGDAFYAAQY